MNGAGEERGPDPGGDVATVPDERNEHVLHTRVPHSLDRRLKRRARTLGMSVSTVVRHVLLNTFGLVEDIVTDGANVALSLAGEEVMPRGRRPGGPDRAEAAGEGAGEILGWQEAVLNLNAVCDRCNAVLRRGGRAAIGIREHPGPRAILCRKCLGVLTGARRR